jgi:sulfotransferase family protein
VGRPILITGMARSGGSWVSRMVAGSGEVVHINEPFNRRHPPGLTPGILDVPPPRAYQYVGAHNEERYVAGFRDMLRLRYNVAAELRTNRGVYDLAKMAKYATVFSHGRARGRRPLVDDPYMVFAAEWMAERLDCQVVMLVRHPAGIVSSMARIGTGWSDNLPDIAAQPELVRDHLAPYAAELERAAREPFDPIAHGALLWRLIHAGIARQVERNPRFVVVRYEDLAADPMNEFRKLYSRLDGVTFTRDAAETVRRGCLAEPAQRQVPWGRVGLGRTAFQPMQSGANAWAWRDRLTAEQAADVVARTRDVAERFYTPAELEGGPGIATAAAASTVPPRVRVTHRRWRSA